MSTLHLITHQNCVVHTTVVNNADTSRTFGKDTKIAIGHTNFHQHSAFTSEATSLISHCPTNQPTITSTIDPLDLLCPHMPHLPRNQFLEAKQVLSDFKDIFSVSNTQIGRTNISSFDVQLEHNQFQCRSINKTLFAVCSNNIMILVSLNTMTLRIVHPLFLSRKRMSPTALI